MLEEKTDHQARGKKVRAGKYTLIFGLILLVALTVFLLRWSVEAIFFLTWLFAALFVQHDNRLSIVIGLLFIATCPFLLIAKMEAVAEGAANYAYFFLAIGVLVQLEDMLLERWGWYDLKLDLSPILGPLLGTLRWWWQELADEIIRQRPASAWVALARRTQIGLPAALLIGAIVVFILGYGIATIILLIAAFLSALLIAGLTLAGKMLSGRFVVAVGAALLALPFLAFGLAALYDLNLSMNSSLRPPYYDFASELAKAKRSTDDPRLVDVREWAFSEGKRRVLYQHPDPESGYTRLEYQVDIPLSCILLSGIALAPESWRKEGDGVLFQLYLEDGQGLHLLFSRYIDPKNNPEDRKYHPFRLELSHYQGQARKLIFVTDAGPREDVRNDWAGWIEPKLFSW